jgi:hypothetical protein
MPRPARTNNVQVIIGQSIPPRPLAEVTGPDIMGNGAARLIRSYRGQRHKPVWRWFATTRRLILCESHLEAVRLDLADFDTEVIAAKAQPFWASGSFRGKPIRHVPDFLFELRGGRYLLVNVKHPAAAYRDDALRVSAWAAHVARDRGWQYEYWTGEHEPGQLVPNLQALHGYANPSKFDPSLVAAILRSSGGTLRAVVEELPEWPGRQVRATVLHCLWTKALVSDLTVALTSDTPLARPVTKS